MAHEVLSGNFGNVEINPTVGKKLENIMFSVSDIN
jgi:hypothetical protein